MSSPSSPVITFRVPSQPWPAGGGAGALPDFLMVAYLLARHEVIPHPHLDQADLLQAGRSQGVLVVDGLGLQELALVLIH